MISAAGHRSSTLQRTGIAAMALIGAFMAPVAGQERDAPVAIETEFAPYALGQAGEDVTLSFERPWRTDTVTIRAGGLIENYGQMEYKVTMEKDDILLYSWTASDDLYYEFHGHPLNPDGSYGDAILYRHEEGRESHGFIRAPLDGIHGWYFINNLFDQPIEIELTLAGTYTLEPGVIGSAE